MDLEAGFYNGTQMVTISNNESNSILRYTINGHNPTPSSPEYTGPIQITKTTVVKAMSFSTNDEILPGKLIISLFFTTKRSVYHKR